MNSPEKAAEGAGFEVFLAPTGPLETNTYLLVSGDKAAIIDPGGWPETLELEILRRKLELSRILVTHVHADHIGGCGELKKRFPKAVFTVPAEETGWLKHPAYSLSYFVGGLEDLPEPEHAVKPDDEIPLGMLRLRALLLPGHTPASTAYYAAEQSLLFCGDVLFEGSIGRTDMPGGSEAAMRRSLALLRQMPGETLVFPGHGPTTRMSTEFTHNPFLTP
ncbi:MAG TPA: MBL fold metallo-hydrolase [Planctomycetes bacterium]|nr:MBL fold metallo-hydrolase [Planctomycetota bacterium]